MTRKSGTRESGAIAWRLAAIAAVGLVLVACVGRQTTRYGMVRDPDTGLMIGSVLSDAIVTDPSFHANRRIKVRVRNLSGDAAFDLKRFGDELAAAYVETGYDAADGDDFGILVDLNVLESGQAQRNMAQDYAFLGAVAGGLAGAQRGGVVATGAGIAAGATLGSVLGGFRTEDTYIVIAEITVATVKGGETKPGKTITFSRSPAPAEDEEDRRTKEDRRTRRGIDRSHRTTVAVFAGGTSTPQSRIAGMVRERLVRIARDIL